MTAEEINSIAGTPEEISTFGSNQTWTGNDGTMGSLWLQDPAWDWPQMVPNMPVMEPRPSALRTTSSPIKDAIGPGFVLDPALNLGGTALQSSSSIPSGNLCDASPYDNMLWLSRPSAQFESIPVGPTTTNHQSSRNTSDHGCHGRSQSTPTPTSTPTLSGEAARIAQEATLKELVLLSTSIFTVSNHHSGDRNWFWQSMSSKIELAFSLDGMASRDSNIFEHFIKLFYKFFNVSWPTKQPDVAAVDAFPPHLYLMMAAIGAAYAGPKADAFHLQVLDALRPSLVDAALHKTLTPETIFPLIQSLALLQAAMINFSDRKALEIAPGLSNLIVSLCRRISLFEGASYGGSQNTKKRLAYGVARLDAAVACLFGMTTLLTEDEERNVQIPDGAEDVLDRLLQKATATATANRRSGYSNPNQTGWHHYES